jgi:hypothetical protein
MPVMGNSYKFRSDRNSGGLFASTVVLTLFVFGGIVVGSVAFPRDPGTVWLVAGGGFLFILLMVWLLRDRPQGTLRESFSWMSRRSSEPSVDYEPRVIKAERSRYGTNRPPTAEEIRDLKEGDRNWVPSNTPAGQRRRRRK